MGELERVLPRRQKVLVGVKLRTRGEGIAEDCGLLVQFALDRVVTPGDEVVVVNVLQRSAALGSTLMAAADSRDMLVQEAAALDTALRRHAVPFVTLGHAKQVTVSSRVLFAERQKDAVADALAVEAVWEAATVLLVGSSGKRHFTGGVYHGPGEYCIRNVPPMCTVMIVRSNRILFDQPGRLGSPDSPSDHSRWGGGLSVFVPPIRHASGGSGSSVSSASTASSQPTRSPHQRSGADLNGTMSSTPTRVDGQHGYQLSSMPPRSPPGMPPSPLLLQGRRIPSDLDLSEDCIRQLASLGTTHRRHFSYDEIVSATGNFAEENFLGEGACGDVFRGMLALELGGHTVAVKRLKKAGEAGLKQIGTELETLSGLHHRHIVALRGWCIEPKAVLLIFDFMPNGSLDRVLRGEAAAVSDLGLAKLSQDNQNVSCTNIYGTWGYIAPEYYESGKVGEATDVYAFGVVLFQLISGRGPIDTSSGERRSLASWAILHAKEPRFDDVLVDPRLDGDYDPTQLRVMTMVAFLCIADDPAERPRMSEIVRWLSSSSFQPSNLRRPSASPPQSNRVPP
eukprot:SM000104S09355  [mRNA]  locus=s104:305998:310099:+ [translate_table: standard]